MLISGLRTPILLVMAGLDPAIQLYRISARMLLAVQRHAAAALFPENLARR